MTNSMLYLNGSIISAASAALSPLDIGLLRGLAVFDLLRTVHGRPFLLREHLDRLHASARELGLKVPVSDEDIATAIDELLRLNGHVEATVRLVLTGGVSPDGMEFDPETPTFMIVTHELHEPPPEIYLKGARLMLVEHQRELPAAKSSGALDLLYHDGTRVLEAATASVYFVRDGEVLAPDSDVLRGTVGELILGLAGPHHPVRHTTVTLEDAFSADEVFLTSTTRGVVPIVMLDESPVGTGDVGPITSELITRFRSALDMNG